jgi:hypothetical protein
MHRVALLAFSAIALSGCATNTELADRDCRSAGFQPGTSAFASCHMVAMQRRQAQSDRMIATGLGMAAGSQPRPQPPRNHTYMINGRRVHCSTVGDSTTCF